MGRSVGLEGTLGARLAAVAGRGPGASGVLVGTMVEDSAHVVFLAETPEEEEEGEQGTPRELDVSWMAEHAKQVLRLLPGGLTVLGFFLAQPDSFLVANDGKLRKLLRSTAGLDPSVPAELLVLQSALTGKVLDSKTASFRSVEVRTVGRPVRYRRLESQLVLDIPVALESDSEPLGEDVKPAMAKFGRMLDTAIYIFGDRVLNDEAVIGKPVVVEGRKGKGKAAKVEEEDEEPEEQEVMTVELLATEPPLEDVVVEEGTRARMKLAGKLSCRAYLPPGARVAWARAAVAADLTRSLATRLAMHAESLLGPDQEPETEDKVVHEPPRRVFVSVPDTEVTVCDYLYPGEGTEDCLGNIKEIFGWELHEDSIEDDLEIVASPREARPAGQAGDTRARRPVPAGWLLGLAVAALSAGLAWVRLGGGGEEEGEAEL